MTTVAADGYAAVERAADLEVAAGTTDNQDSAALHVPADIFFLCCYSSQSLSISKTGDRKR